MSWAYRPHILFKKPPSPLLQKIMLHMPQFGQNVTNLILGCGHQAIPHGKSFFLDDHGVRHQESSLFPQFVSDYFPAVSFADIPKGCFYFYGMSSQTSSFDLKSYVLPLPFFFSAGAASDLISHKASHLK